MLSHKMRHDLVDCVQPRANDVTEVSPIRLGGIYRQSPTKGVTEENLLCLRIKSLLEKLLPKSNRGVVMVIAKFELFG